jgi:hypothetical protein
MKKIYLILVALLSVYSMQAQVVINEVYGGGGNAGATYKNDFIELYNNGTSAVNLSGWSVQYASSAGTTWATTALTGSIAPGGYYLIQEAAGAGGTTNLPTPDATGNIAMSGTAGRVILVNLTTAQTGCPVGTQIIDKVGFGSAATCFEGTGPTPAPSNTTSVSRSATHTDTESNSADFTASSPTPLNTAGPDVTAPTTVSLVPANAATGVSTSFTANITFSESVAKGTSGTIILKLASDNSTVQTIDVPTSVTITGSTASFDINSLGFSTGYYFEVSAGAFKDLSNNNFAGFTGSGTWSFTTGATAATGTVGTTYAFNTCSSSLTDGFTQFSAAGQQVWACTTFGRDPAAPTGTAAAPNGVQINGFNVTNILNEDWFISPSFDLTATTFPLLSFWSRNAFNGAPLQLKVSTDYPGTGDPRNFTWTDVDGRFPAQASNTWTLTQNINLTAYKSTATYFAFVYNSSADDGARWTLDDITVTNSATAPPAFLTTSTNDLAFGYAAATTSTVKTFSFTGSDLTGPVDLTATGNFLISKTNGSFTSTINFTQVEANNIPQTVYVQFTPPAASQDYTGTVTVSTPGVPDAVINLTGNSLDPATTLEVVNWNLEWFGSSTLGPTNDAQQEANVKTITQNIGADIFGFVEVVDETRLQNVVSNLNAQYGAGTYAYVICNYGSHTNPFEAGAGPLNEAQKEAFVYKTAVITPIGTPGPLVTDGVNTAADLNNPAYNYFSSGRYPFMMNANVTLGGITKTVRFVLIHAKANTSPTATAYARRKAGSDTLNFTLKNLYPNDNIVLLGDFNDDLDQSITAGFTTTSYSAFTTDNANFYSPTLPLSQAGKKSTVSYNDVIDHVEISNEMYPYYMSGTAAILTDVSSLVANYGSTTTDHYPVFTRYAFDAAILPVTLLSFNATKQNNAVTVAWATAQEINSKYFIVERSTDGRSWSTVTTVNAAGNSNNKKYYNYVDNSPAKGINFYRLKLVDADNKFTRSDVKTVLFSNIYQVKIAPNPATDFVTVYVSKNSNTPNQLIITDMAGKTIEKIVTADQTIRINTTKYAKAVYYIKIINDEEVTTQQFIVR